MNITPRPISKHRRARLIAWTLAMLAWMLQVLFSGTLFSARHERQRCLAMSLAGLTRQVKLLIISRAIDLAGVRSRPRGQRSSGQRMLLPHGFINALIGARVRRMLKRKTLGARIIALLHALRHLDAYAALVARRVKRGLTRRWLALLALPAAPAARVVTLAAPDASFADTS